jgi:hypothetical protein
MSMAYIAQPDQLRCPRQSSPRPDGFEIPTARLAEASEKFGNVIVGPPR